MHWPGRVARRDESVLDGLLHIAAPTASLMVIVEREITQHTIKSLKRWRADAAQNRIDALAGSPPPSLATSF
jgi:hypothetical protein